MKNILVLAVLLCSTPLWAADSLEGNAVPVCKVDEAGACATPANSNKSSAPATTAAKPANKIMPHKKHKTPPSTANTPATTTGN